MMFVCIFMGLIILWLGLLLYQLRRNRRPARPSLRCVEHMTARGERMRFLLAPREEHEEPEAPDHSLARLSDRGKRT